MKRNTLEQLINVAKNGAAKEHPTLCGVLIEPVDDASVRLVASDGKGLAAKVIRDDMAQHVKEALWFDVADLKVAALLLKSLPKGIGGINAEVRDNGLHFSYGNIGFTLTAGHTYPDYTRIFETSPVIAEVIIDAEILRRYAEALKADRRGIPALTLQFHGPNKPLTLIGPTGDKGMLMPRIK